MKIEPAARVQGRLHRFGKEPNQTIAVVKTSAYGSEDLRKAAAPTDEMQRDLFHSPRSSMRHARLTKVFHITTPTFLRLGNRMQPVLTRQVHCTSRTRTHVMEQCHVNGFGVPFALLQLVGVVSRQ